MVKREEGMEMGTVGTVIVPITDFSLVKLSRILTILGKSKNQLLPKATAIKQFVEGNALMSVTFVKRAIMLIIPLIVRVLILLIFQVHV